MVNLSYKNKNLLFISQHKNTHLYMILIYDTFIFTLIMQSQSANIALIKITSTLLSNREYIISSNNLINPMLSLLAKTMFIKLNKITLYVNFKKRIYSYTHYNNRGIPLYLHQNNLTYNYTGKI